MALSLQHVYECDFCGQLVRETQTQLLPIHDIRRQMVPDGWAWIGQMLACPSHNVKVDHAVVVLACRVKAIA